jgi:hypothetical protein
MKGFLLFTAASRPALEPTQPPNQWVPAALTPEEKWLGHEVNSSPPSIAKLKDGWSYTSTPQYVFMAWCLVKRRGTFNFTMSFKK